MSNRIVRGVAAALTLGALSGCAGGPAAVHPDEPIATEPLAGEEVQRSETVYSLLAAEMAGQKGDFSTALDAYLQAARVTKDAKVAERATQIALYAKQSDLALEAVQLWVAADPDNPAAQKIIATLLLKNGRIPEAITHLDRVLQRSDVDLENVMVDVARLLGQELPKAEALHTLADLAERYPQRAEVQYAYSVLALENDDVKTAQAALDKVLALKPNWNRARALQAQLAARGGNNKQAQAILERALRAEPNNQRMRLVLAEQFMRQNRLKDAEAQFRKVLQAENSNEDAAFGLAMVLLQQHKEDAAQKLLTHLAEGERWTSQAAYYLGLLASRHKHYESALEWFEQVDNGNLALDAQSNAASILLSLKRDKEAQEKLAELRKRFPQESLRFYLMEGELLTRNNNYQAAFDLLSEALQSLPDRPELLYTRALVAEHVDRLDVLEQDIQTILKQNPDDANALNALGYTLANKTSRFSEAEDLLNRALTLRPDDPAILDSFGWLQYRLGNNESAIDYLRRAYSKNPDPEIAAHLGEVLWNAGRKSDAKSIWRTAAKKAPDNEHIVRVKTQYPEAFE